MEHSQATSLPDAPTADLQQHLASYQSTLQINDTVWTTFQTRTDSVPFLKAHRDWVEKNAWGFGDRAFHYMWYLILRDDVLKRPKPKLLEIGVYKGQVISLWALIAIQLQSSAMVTAISPFESAKPWFAQSRVLNRIAQMLFKAYRDDIRSANLYENENYLECVHRIFRQFGLSEANVTFLRGYSQDPHVYQQVTDRAFDVIYIDGGHRYEQVIQDLTNYSRLVTAGGYLVLDDASCNQPGSKFWKGHESVSRAADDWGAPGFTNVLNVGHNRVYRRDP
jgi:hypothetical protein